MLIMKSLDDNLMRLETPGTSNHSQDQTEWTVHRAIQRRLMNVSAYRRLSAFKTLEITDVLKLHMSFAAFCLRKAHCLCKNGEKLGLELGLMLALGMVVAQFSRSE